MGLGLQQSPGPPMATGHVRPRILVVDDYAGAREAVCLMLDALGYEAEGVSGGAEALDRLATRVYAVVISDLVMPGVCGWTVADHVRQRRPDIGLVLMTGYCTSEAARRARELDVSLLEKPFSTVGLRTAIEEAMRANQPP
jgi:CheY-like chemotaxis protein